MVALVSFFNASPATPFPAARDLRLADAPLLALLLPLAPAHAHQVVRVLVPERFPWARAALERAAEERRPTTIGKADNR